VQQLFDSDALTRHAHVFGIELVLEVDIRERGGRGIGYGLGIFWVELSFDLEDIRGKHL
jgi:hypothetical protein